MARATITERAAGRIREVLETKGRTQEWLSEATGIPMRTLARRLHKTHPSGMSLDELADMASALEVDLVSLVKPAAPEASRVLAVAS